MFLDKSVDKSFFRTGQGIARLTESLMTIAFARFIDHTLLKPEATEGDIRQLVREAVEHRFAGVCVNGRWVNLVSELLHEAKADEGEYPVATCAVVGFP